jgi:hypothetical protein
MVLGLLLLLAFRLRSVSSCAVGLALLTCKKKGSQPVAVLLCEKGWRRQGKKKGFIDWPVDMGGAAVPATSSLRKCFKAIENTA